MARHFTSRSRQCWPLPPPRPTASPPPPLPPPPQQLPHPICHPLPHIHLRCPPPSKPTAPSTPSLSNMLTQTESRRDSSWDCTHHPRFSTSRVSCWEGRWAEKPEMHHLSMTERKCTCVDISPCWFVCCLLSCFRRCVLLHVVYTCWATVKRWW